MDVTSQRVVLITGCSFGLGRKLANTFAADEQKRYKVWATVRALDEKDTLEQEAGPLLNKTLFIKELDLMKPQSIEDAAHQILEEDGRVDILINNAATSLFGPLEAIDMAAGRNVFEIVFFGHLQLMKLIIPSMKARRWGRIINISTCATLIAQPFSDYYVASKLALEGLSGCQASSLRPFNVWVSIVQLSAVTTEITMDLFVHGNYEEKLVNKNIDGATKKMLDKLMDFVKREMISEYVQTPQQIAEFIQTVAESESPKLRYLSSSGGQYLASQVFRDPSGEAGVQTALDVLSTE